MYLNKHFNINNVSLDKYDFDRELNMESFIIENEGMIQINSDWLKDVSILLSQEPLPNARKKTGKNDGRVDIVAIYNQEYLAIIELKKGKLNKKDHLDDQLQAYLSERDQIIKNYENIWDSKLKGPPKWIGILIGNSIEKELMDYISTQPTGKDVIPIAAIIINRFRGSDKNIYTVSDVYFNEKHKPKNYDTYNYDGRIFNKGRLALAVIKDHVLKNPKITYSKLEQLFPRTFNTLEYALEKENGRRHFIKDDELIVLGNNLIIAVTNQWGVNITPFIKRCNDKELNLNIKKS